MATLGDRVGDYPIDCPLCTETIAAPVVVQSTTPKSRHEVELRALVDLDPVREHLHQVHGVRLSRPQRR